MLPFNNNFYIKYQQEFPHDFLNVESIFLLLSFITFAQRKSNRIAYYSYCCFISTFTQVQHRTYATWVYNYVNQTRLLEKLRPGMLDIMRRNSEDKPFMMLESFWENTYPLRKIHLNLFKIQQDNLVFHGLETYYNDIYIDSFTSDYFYEETQDYVYLLPYKNYILKVKYSMYVIVWLHLEKVRQKKYNEYVKMHPKINYYENCHIRTMYTEEPPVMKGEPVKGGGFYTKGEWLITWLLELKKQKYYILFIKLRGKIKMDIKFNKTIENMYKDSTQSKLLKIAAQMELLNRVRVPQYKAASKYLRRSLNIIAGIESCMTLVRYHHWFIDQVILDFHDFWQCYYMCTTSCHTYIKRIKIDLIEWEKKFFTEFENKAKISNYYILEDLGLDNSNWTDNNVHYKLGYRLFGLLISRIMPNLHTILWWSNMYLRYNNERTFGRDWTRCKNLIINFKNVGFYKKSYKIDTTVGRVVFYPTQYDYWRSLDSDFMYNVVDGRLHNTYIYRWVKADMELSSRRNTVFQQILTTLNGYNLNLPVPRWKTPKLKYKPKKLKKSLSQMSKGLNGLALQTQYWGQKTCKELQDIYSNKSMPFAVLSILNNMYVQITWNSWEISFISFFCLFETVVTYESECYYAELQSNKFHTLLQAHMMSRRYIADYRSDWSQFKRLLFVDELKALTKGTTIHGKDPRRLIDWEVHANWMRIIGLTPAETPFYYKKKRKDNEGNLHYDWWLYLIELSKQKKNQRIKMRHTKLYTVYNDSKKKKTF